MEVGETEVHEQTTAAETLWSLGALKTNVLKEC